MILIAKMAKRARLTTTDVLDAIYSDEDDSDVDDPDEPFMYGSDDEFSDLNGEDDYPDDEDNDNMDTSPPHSPPQAPPAANSTQPDNLPKKWTTSLKSVNIEPFQSAVGPTVPIPDSPLEVFNLLFTTNLLQMIVDESNR